MHALTVRIPFLAVLASALGLAAPAPAWAQSSCTMQVPGLVFGEYDTFDNSPTRASTRITVSCVGSLRKVQPRIELSTGSSQTFTARTQTSGSNALTYNIYADHALTQVVGDGTGGTTALLPVVDSQAPLVMKVDLYGAIDPRQPVPPGSYFDSVYVTLIF